MSILNIFRRGLLINIDFPCLSFEEMVDIFFPYGEAFSNRHYVAMDASRYEPLKGSCRSLKQRPLRSSTVTLVELVESTHLPRPLPFPPRKLPRLPPRLPRPPRLFCPPRLLESFLPGLES